MNTQERLISALAAKYEGESDASIARRAGLSAQRFNNYKSGLRAMDTDAVIGCCAALGEPADGWVRSHNADAAKTQRERNFWRRFGSAAAVMLMCGTTLFPGVSASKSTSYANGPQYTLCAVAGRWLRRVLRAQVRPLALSPA